MLGSPPQLRIKRRFERPGAEVLAPFARRSTSFVVDAMFGSGALDAGIKPIDPAMRFAGVALTAQAGARDNLAVIAALDHLQPGDVLMIAADAFEGTAVLGDNVARIAKARGAVALVADGMARDAAELLEVGLPIFCRGITPNSAHPSGPATVGLPVVMGGMTVTSGDVVIGDRDGVVVVPRERAAHVAAQLEEVAAGEADLQRRIGAGPVSLLREGTRIEYLD